MKRKIFVLGALLSFFVSIMTIGSSCSTTRSAETAYQDSIANIAAQRMLQQGNFVLLGERLTFGRMSTRTVTPNTNFIIVRNGEATVQASPGIAGGPNGVGGITFTGTITNYRVTTDKKGRTTAKFHLSAPIGSSDVTVTLEKGYNGATGYVSGDFTGRDIVLGGKIQSTGDARFIEGRSR